MAVNLKCGENNKNHESGSNSQGKIRFKNIHTYKDRHFNVRFLGAKKCVVFN